MTPRTLVFVVPLLLAFAPGCGNSADPEEGSPGGSGGIVSGGGAGGEDSPGGAGGEGGGEGGGGGAIGEGGSGGKEGSRISSFRLEFLDICIIPPTPACAVIRVGWTRNLRVVATDHRGEPIEDLEISWASSDDEVVTVDQKGRVTAIGAGMARITASAEGHQASQSFTVEVPAVAKIFIAPERLDVKEGVTIFFNATAFAQDHEGNLTDEIPDAEIGWMVANPYVAEVEAPGAICGIGPGATWVIAGSPDGIPAHEGHALLVVTSEDPIPPGMELESIALGPTHGCGLAPDGVIHCWGRNEEGQLGLGYQDDPTASFPTPGPIEADPLLNFSAISSSGGNCGIDQTGLAWCWGNNTSGQLGLGKEVPGSPEAMPMVGDHSFTKIALGLGFGCGIDVGKKAWCWGSNASGEVGMGEVGRDKLSSPDWEEYWWAWEPTEVVGEHSFVQIQAGLWTACALDDQGKAWCWGENDLATLGNGDRSVRASGEPVAVVGDHRFVSLSLGSSHACGLTEAGEAWCWGRNYSGQLGAPSPNPLGEPMSFEPIRVGGDQLFTAIATGAFHSCAIDQEGVAWCWGNNEYGQAGTAIHSESIELPTPVYGELRFSQIFAGSHRSCGITTAGRGYCWGDNMFGNLGLGYSDGLSPVPWPIAQPK